MHLKKEHDNRDRFAKIQWTTQKTLMSFGRIKTKVAIIHRITFTKRSISALHGL